MDGITHKKLPRLRPSGVMYNDQLTVGTNMTSICPFAWLGKRFGNVCYSSEGSTLYVPEIGFTAERVGKQRCLSVSEHATFGGAVASDSGFHNFPLR